MKETVKINLSQRLFDLDGDAYSKLNDYLESLKKFFKKSSTEADDILADIEQRIAEILTEKLGNNKQVVTVADIDLVIEMMGTAEDFAREAELIDEDQTDSSKSEGTQGSKKYNKVHRRLYRDTDINIFGGVCSGLAAYFNIEVIWIRLIFIVLFFVQLIGLIIYAILWAIVPAAKTTAQKLQMHGKAVNVGNIQDSVKTEFNKVKDNFKNFSDSPAYKQSRDRVSEFASSLGSAFQVFLKIFLVIIGVGIAVAGLVLLISLITAVAAGGFWNGWNFIPDFSWNEPILALFRDVSLFGLAVFIVILVPIIGILSAIIRLVFNLKKGSSIGSAFAWTIWALALVFVLITLIMGVNMVSFSHHYKDVKELDISQDKVLYLRLDEDNFSHRGNDFYTIFGKEVVRDKWNDSFLLEPEVSIEQSNNENASLKIEYATLIPWEDYRGFESYHFTLNDSLLVIDNYWRVDEDEIWRLPKVKLTLYIPENQKIHIDSDFKHVDTSTEEYAKWPDRFYKEVLIMEDNSLTRIR